MHDELNEKGEDTQTACDEKIEYLGYLLNE